MDFDQLQRTWQSQGSGPRLAIDPEMLLNEIRRNKRNFEATVFWRDVREVGVNGLMGAFFLCLGITLLEWEWFVLALSMLWLVGFLLVGRMRQKRNTPVLREPLTACIASSLAQVNYQIWLLKNVLWWYLLPPGIGLAVAFCSFAWEVRDAWGLSLIFLAMVGLCAVWFWFVYWLNQRCVRKELLPRRQELEALLKSLKATES
jgi:hypothetical protein